MVQARYDEGQAAGVAPDPHRVAGVAQLGEVGQPQRGQQRLGVGGGTFETTELDVPDGTVLVNTGKITERPRHEPEHAVKI